MFKNAFILFVLLAFLFAGWACKRSTYPQFETREFEKKAGDCDQTSCIDIVLKYHVIKEEYKASKSFNHVVMQKIFSKMGNEEENLQPEQYVSRLLKDFEAFKKEYPDAVSGGYQQHSQTEITFRGREIISVLLKSNVYAGGAHPMDYSEFINFNPDNGEMIDVNNLVKNRFGFRELVETKLREWFGMEPGDRWSDFTLVDQFVMPETMGFVNDGMLLIYNEYEILPYASGPVELTLSHEELSPLMKKPVEPSDK